MNRNKTFRDFDSLYNYYKDYFNVGAALNQKAFRPKTIGSEIAKKHFNLIVAENITKMMFIYKHENKFDFKLADSFVNFGIENNQKIRWHTLVWHSQCPDWIFTKEDKKTFVTAETLDKRLQNYIYTIGERYGSKISSVDVVNEVISDKTSKLRTLEDYSRWYHIMGDSYIKKAFHYAKEAFPKAELVINDYNLESKADKREGMYQLLQNLKKDGVPVDTVGLQMHIDLYTPSVKEIEETIELYNKLGLQVIITEMEVSLFKFDEREHKIISPELLEQQANRYFEVFECFKRASQKGYLKNVVLWGILDEDGWKNNFPVPKRNDPALLFEKKGLVKPAFTKIIGQ